MQLQHVISKKKTALLFDFEHYFKWFDLFALSSTKEEDIVTMNAIYQLLNSILIPEVTGITLSPHFGWNILHSKPAQTGVIFSLEQKSQEQDPLAHPLLSKQWTIEHIANNYGIVKLQLHYHPEEALSMQKRKFISELYEYAHYCGCDFILDIKTTFHTEFVKSEDDFQNTQLTTIKHFRQVCDAFVLESPKHPLAIATVTAELDTPWFLEEVTFSTYDEIKEAVRIAAENGVTGVTVGTNLLRDLELPEKTDAEYQMKLKKVIGTTVRDRVLELRRIIEEGQEQLDV